MCGEGNFLVVCEQMLFQFDPLQIKRQSSASLLFIWQIGWFIQHDFHICFMRTSHTDTQLGYGNGLLTYSVWRTKCIFTYKIDAHAFTAFYLCELIECGWWSRFYISKSSIRKESRWHQVHICMTQKSFWRIPRFIAIPSSFNIKSHSTKVCQKRDNSSLCI